MKRIWSYIRPSYWPSWTNIYVSANGNDMTGDGTEDNPYFTLQAALNKSTKRTTINLGNGCHFQFIDHILKEATDV